MYQKDIPRSYIQESPYQSNSRLSFRGTITVEDWTRNALSEILLLLMRVVTRNKRCFSVVREVFQRVRP